MKTLALSTILALASVGSTEETQEAATSLIQEDGGASTATAEATNPTETQDVEDSTTENEKQKAVEPYHQLPSRCLNARDVSLTFDDGPGNFTQPILDMLDAQGVKATFHVVSKLLTKDSSLMLKQALQNGHNIGLRFDTSINDGNIDQMSLETFREKLIKESESIHHHLGVYPRLLRLPFRFRRLDASFHDLVAELGFVATGWTIDSQDYMEDLTTEQLVEIGYAPILLVDEESKENGSSVQEGFIVLHRDLFNITEVVEGGINLINGAGDGHFRFVTLGECLNLDNVYKTDALGTGSPSNVSDETVDEEDEESEQEEVPAVVGNEAEEDVNETEEQDVADEDFTQNLTTDGAVGKYGFVSSLMLIALGAIFA